MFTCRNCEYWKVAQGAGNRRTCPMWGRLRWAGDPADECTRAKFMTKYGEEVVC